MSARRFHGLLAQRARGRRQQSPDRCETHHVGHAVGDDDHPRAPRHPGRDPHAYHHCRTESSRSLRVEPFDNVAQRLVGLRNRCRKRAGRRRPGLEQAVDAAKGLPAEARLCARRANRDLVVEGDKRNAGGRRALVHPLHLGGDRRNETLSAADVGPGASVAAAGAGSHRSHLLVDFLRGEPGRLKHHASLALLCRLRGCRVGLHIPRRREAGGAHGAADVANEDHAGRLRPCHSCAVGSGSRELELHH